MVIQNTFINMAGRIITAGAGLVMTALLVRHLGQPTYGVLMLAMAIVGNTTVLESSFGVGITRYVAYFQGSEDARQRDRFIGAGFLASILQGAIVGLFIVMGTLIFFQALFGHLDPDLQTDLRILLAVLLLKFIIQVCSISMMRVLEGCQLFKLLRKVDVVFSLALLSGLFMFLRAYPHAPLWWIGWVYVGFEVGRFCLLWEIMRRKGISIAPWSSDRETFCMLFRFGQPLLVAKGMTFLAYRSDAFLIGVFLSAEAVAQYQVASQLGALAVAVISLVTSALLPAISDRVAQRPQDLPETFLRASRYLIFCALAVAAVVVLLRSPFFSVWLGEGFLEAQMLTCLFMLQMLCAHHQGISGLLLIGVDHHHPLAWVESLGSLLQFGLALWLIQQIGVYGVVIAGIVKAVMMSILYTKYALEYLRLTAWTFITDSLLPTWIIGSFVMVLLVFNLMKGGDVSNLGSLIQGAIVLCAMASLLWFVILNERDRRTILRVLNLA